MPPRDNLRFRLASFQASKGATHVDGAGVVVRGDDGDALAFTVLRREFTQRHSVAAGRLRAAVDKVLRLVRHRTGRGAGVCGGGGGGGGALRGAAWRGDKGMARGCGQALGCTT